jgi:capsid assembly protease
MSETATPEQREAERYPQVVRAIRETPWAILEGTLATIIDIVGRRLNGEKLTPEEIQARVGDRQSSRSTVMAGTVAVLPVYGVIIPKATLFSEISGGTSVQRLQADFRDALDDKDISAIVFDIDSPGGMTDGVPELAAELRAARGKKPIVAVANYRAASAAYWLGSQADEFYSSSSADVGSVGVFAAHQDVSGMEEKLGVKTTLIPAKRSPRKTEGNPYEPLSDEARQAIEERVDEMMGMFESDVAKGRRVSVDTVRSDFGQGAMLSAKKALKAGMIDGIATLEDTIRRISRGQAHQPEPIEPDGLDELVDDGESARTFSDAVDEAHRAFEAVVSGAEALRALTGTKREQLAALIERAKGLVAEADEADEQEPGDELASELAVAEATARLRL